MLTDSDFEQIENQGLTIEDIEKQLSRIDNGFSGLKLVSAATINNGIETISEEDIFRYTIVFENFLLSGFKAQKFVPSSGAATRMFKELYEFLLENSSEKKDIVPEHYNEYITLFFNNIEKFAFYRKLACLITNKESKVEIIERLLFDQGLNYFNMPKALVEFHSYGNESRTAFEEHIIEAISYCTCSDGFSKAHFTISQEHKDYFEKTLSNAKFLFQKRFGIHLDVTFSYQPNSTNTVAVDPNNKLLRDKNGNIVFRPGGHGSLLKNLEEQEGDLIFIKTIDNVLPDRLKSDTKLYKKALAGYLVSLRNKIFDFCEKLDHQTAFNNEQLLSKIEIFLEKELKISVPKNFASTKDKISYFKTILNRPLRVCGMVSNTGEPGGGPFWTTNQNGTISLQIVEKSQIDLNDQSQVEIFNSSTHFNPVDIICSIKDYKGNKYNLNDFVDPETGFIVKKIHDGINIRGYEHPGLWNGSMSNWTTLLVEVPNITFAPVKTVNDLLRKDHQ